MNRALGLQQKLMLSLLAATLLLLIVLAGLWRSGTRSNAELAAETAEAIGAQALAELRGRAELHAHFLAELLPNRVYFFDLIGIGEAVRSVLEQPDVLYVLVSDPQGRLLHDGSREIEGFGEPMSDPLAAKASRAERSLVQWSDALVEVSEPIMLGRERIGGVRVGLSRSQADASTAALQATLAARLQHALIEQLRYLMIGFGILLLGAGVLGFAVGRGLVRPIRALASAAGRLEQGHYDALGLDSRRGDELGDLVRAFGRMAEAVRRHDQEIRRLAYQDALTGLPNRLMFRELLDELLQPSESGPRPVGLLFIDLDDFKRINDTLGHDAGDEVLLEFARRLLRCAEQATRESSGERSIVARLGGDEFVALLSGEDLIQRCARLAHALIAELREPFSSADQSLFLSASIGITRYPEDARTAKQLLKSGDLAMYKAKQLGKNCYAFYEGAPIDSADDRMALEQDLRKALERGELELAYQPIVELRSGRIVGAEALLRWPHPRRGYVGPGVFIPIAEGSALIETLGAWVMRRACADAAAWQADSPGLKVAVNIAARQLKRQNLFELIDEALASSGLPAHCLGIELTESGLLHEDMLQSGALARLRAMGIEVWLDDFGTGFSSLSHLRRLEADGVKIDRSFIADLQSDPDDLALTAAVIAMAHAVGMRVIGEGIEHEAQAWLLAERGCDYGQGYWYGAAVSADVFVRRHVATAAPARGLSRSQPT